MESKIPEESRAVISQFMLPSDANVHGNVHGGTIMKLVDTAGGIAAARHAQRMVVTVVIETMTFLSPVFIGQLLTLSAVPIYAGRTSIEVIVDVYAESIINSEKIKTNTARLTYVAINDYGKPTPVPPLKVTTEEEKKLYEAAAARRAARLKEKER